MKDRVKANEKALIDRCLALDLPFALYRLPKDGRHVFTIRETGDVHWWKELGEIKGKRGFVMAPFDRRTSRAEPVLIEPGDIVEGDREAAEMLARLEDRPPVQPSGPGFREMEGEEHAESYEQGFRDIKKWIHEESVEKVVLSRRMTFSMERMGSPAEVFARGVREYPGAFVYLANIPGHGTWFGATPETLVRGGHFHLRTEAVAGTRNATEGPKSWPAKEKHEHALVADHVEKSLRHLGLKNYRKVGPVTIRAGNICHLRTGFESDHLMDDQVGVLAEVLHPTPAVAGTPVDKAVESIRLVEDFDREYYTGFIGPWNLQDESALFVNLRCAQWKKDGVRLYAGGGITNDSDLEAEWEETELKAETMKKIMGAGELV